MNKKSLVISILIILILAVGSFVFFNYSETNNSSETSETLNSSTIDEVTEDSEDASSSTKDSTNEVPTENTSKSEEADETLESFVQIGETLPLYSHHNSQGETRDNFTPYLGWEGTINLCVNSVTVKDYDPTDENLDTDKWELYINESGFSKVIHIELSLTSVDAENSYDVAYDFSSSMFQLGSYDDLIPENYHDSENYTPTGNKFACSEFILNPQGDENNYYHFSLEPGETKVFTLDYLVNDEFLSQESKFLGISLSREFKYGVLLDNMQIE